MIAVFCLLVVLGLGRCQDNDLPSGFEIESSINRTIEEVERKVRDDPSLPRLTRQQIVDILYNITSNELNLYQNKEKMEKARTMYQRALMVVLPYNAQDSSVDLNDLYTKPPMTQIIPDDLKGGNYKYVTRGQKERNEIVVDLKEPIGKHRQTVPSTIENLVSTRGSHASPTRGTQTTTLRNRYKNHRETYSDVQTKAPLKETLRLDSSPVKFTFDLDDLRKNALTTERTTAARHPVYKSTSNGNIKSDGNLEVIYSTSATIEPTKKTATKVIAIDLEESKSSASTSKPQSVLSANQWRYNAPPSTALKSPKPFKVSEYNDKGSLSPTTIKIRPEDGVVVSTTRQPDTVIRSSNVETMDEEFVKTDEPATVYVTPMSTETSVRSKYSSTYSLNSGGFRTVTTTTTQQPMREEVMTLLASIGLSPDNSSNVEDVYKKNKENLELKSQIQNLNNVIHTTVSGLSSVGPDAVSMANQNTFDGAGSEIDKGVANLTPDVQLLFQRFGLQTSNPDRTTTSTTQRPTVNLNSYTNFKPLPTSRVKDQGMKEFLAKFGLGLGDRRQKAMKSSSKRPSLIESVPDNMKNILENIGLISRRRKVPNVVEEDRDMESTETTNYHVFKPHEVDLKDEDQRTRINELLDTVRMVQEGKGDIREVKKAATDLLRATKTLKDGPDPLSLEEIIRIYNEDVKNEVKRQQEETTTVSAEDQDTTTAAAPMTESAETTLAAITTMTDSAKAASDLMESTTATTTTSTAPTNLLALEESFGGTTREPDPVLPTRRKSGLYFLVDWNTFLEVGEEDQGKVNLRFQPKAGDRTRFLPVTVP